MVDLDFVPPLPQALADKRVAWFKNERERAGVEGRKPLPCGLKTRAQLLENWRKRIERAGSNNVYTGERARARVRGVRVQVEEVCTHSRGGSASAESQVAVGKPEGCEGGSVVTVTPAASTPAVLEAVVKPAWIQKAELDCGNVEFVGFESGEPCFRLTRKGVPMAWADDDEGRLEVARLRPKGFRNKRVNKIEAEEGWWLVGWDDDDTEVFVERT